MNNIYIKLEKKQSFNEDYFYNKCNKEKMIYAAIRDNTKWAEIRVDADTLGAETYDKINEYISENKVDIFENVKHMISSFLDYGSERIIDKCYSVGAFTWANVRKEMAPVIVAAIVEILNDIVANKI